MTLKLRERKNDKRCKHEKPSSSCSLTAEISIITDFKRLDKRLPFQTSQVSSYSPICILKIMRGTNSSCLTNCFVAHLLILSHQGDEVFMAYVVLSKQFESQRARIDYPARNFQSRQYNLSHKA